MPLRFWKFNGVNSVEIGIIDIQFGRYLKKETMDRENGDSFNDNFMEFLNSSGKKRVVVSEKITSKLRRTKLDEVSARAELNYTVYRKKYV